MVAVKGRWDCSRLLRRLDAIAMPKAPLVLHWPVRTIVALDSNLREQYRANSLPGRRSALLTAMASMLDFSSADEVQLVGSRRAMRPIAFYRLIESAKSTNTEWLLKYQSTPS